MLELVKATSEDLDDAVQIVHKTIQATYPPHYSAEVVDFFCNVIHTRENIHQDIQDGTLWLVRSGGIPAGTGCAKGNEIGRIYILPEHQKEGCGSFMMDFLEQRVTREHDTACLSPSLAAGDFYKKRGYVLTDHREYPMEHGSILVRDTLEKRLR